MSFWSNDEIEAYAPISIINNLANVNPLIFKNRLTKDDEQHISEEDKLIRKRLIKRRAQIKYDIKNPGKKESKLKMLKEKYPRVVSNVVSNEVE